jgi:fermentation-respiration switch protein FrsA (DUF1100 family)
MWRRRIARAFVLYAVIPYAAVIVIFTAFQRRLIYRPEKVASLAAEPGRFLPHIAQDIQVRTKDGLILKGWLIRSAATEHDQSVHPLVIYFPGNSGNRETRRVDLKEVAAAGTDVMVVDYRGYGDSPGSPSEKTIATDAHAVWEAATHDYGYLPYRILVFGESLGGAVAVRLCAELSDSGTPPAALVVTSTFSSLPNVAAWSYPAFPFRYLLLDRFDSAARIARITCPVTIIHGTDDEIVPIEEGRRLFEAAPAQSSSGVDKRWEQVPRMGHNDVPTHLLSEILTATLTSGRR